MRRMLSALVLAALAVVLFGGVAQAQVPAAWDGKWRTSKVSTLGYVDSATASINGALATVDTTTGFSTAPVEWGLSSTPATAYGCMRLVVTGATSANIDSLFYAAESGDGANWASNTTFIAMTATAGDKYISGPITCQSTAVGSTGAGTPWLQPYLRFRIRADGNTSALLSGAQVKVVYFRRGMF